jgi:hypothetical protein
MKPIIFTGDSFTFGEGLELYDSNIYDLIKQKSINQPPNHKYFYRWDVFEIISSGGTASNIRNKYKFPTLVSDRLNTSFLSKNYNGGDNIEALEFVEQILEIYSSNDFSCVIMNLTDLFRDEFQVGKEYLRNKLDIVIDDGNTKILEPFMLDWFRWDYITNGAPFIDENKYNEHFGNHAFNINQARKLQLEYKSYNSFEEDMHTRTYHAMISMIQKINIPTYFIGHWSKPDNDVLLRLKDTQIQETIIDNIIPVHIDNKKYDNLAYLPKDSSLFIHEEFPWTQNQHPSKSLHEILATSIVEFIKNK